MALLLADRGRQGDRTVLGAIRCRSLGLLVALGVVLILTPLAAHPTAETEVILTLAPDGAVDLALTTDLDALVIKLETLAGKAPSGDLSTLALEGRIAALRTTILEHVDVRFDGKPARIDLSRVDRPRDRKGKVTVRLAGRVPAGASTVTWSTSLVYGSYVFAVRSTSGSRQVEAFEWLNGPERSQAYGSGAIRTATGPSFIWRGVALGFTHIVPHGLDHILFVLGLFLLAANARTVLLQVSAFTLAHSITLGLALFGLVSVPSAVVEPLIALSIAYVALENLFVTSLTRWRLLLVFLFGLLHGLGFAEALLSLNPPPSQLIGMLVAFNAGVEGGQLAVILMAALLVRTLGLRGADYRRLIVRPASIAIGLAGAYWLVERITQL
jgi:HupE / UreJ protein